MSANGLGAVPPGCRQQEVPVIAPLLTTVPPMGAGPPAWLYPALARAHGTDLPLFSALGMLRSKSPTSNSLTRGQPVIYFHAP